VALLKLENNGHFLDKLNLAIVISQKFRLSDYTVMGGKASHTKQFQCFPTSQMFSPDARQTD